MSSDVSSVTSHFSSANEGFATSLSSNILAGATVVPLTDLSGLTDATVFVGIVDPGQNTEQVFTGMVDTSGARITGVVWTKGDSVDHATGASVVDYVTGTGHNMMTKGLLVAHNQDGTLKTNVAITTNAATFTSPSLTTPKVITSINDTNGNEVLKVSATSSAVNELTLANAVTGNYPSLSATGGDTNIDFNIATKGTGVLRYNGTEFSPFNKDAVRFFPGQVYTSTPTGTFAIFNGTGWDFASWIESDGTQNSEITYDIYLDPGTYTIVTKMRTGNDKGIVTMTLGGSSVGSTTDLYAGSGTTQVTRTDTGVVIADSDGGDIYTLSYKTATKNASSSSYKLPIFYFSFVKTA